MTRDQRSLLQDLLDLEGSLTEWEVNFLERLSPLQKLSDSQLDKFHEIAKKQGLIT